MVLEVPPRARLGAIDDQWFRWVIDIGLPGPDRREGGKYLIVPPGNEVMHNFGKVPDAPKNGWARREEGRSPPSPRRRGVSAARPVVASVNLETTS